jgi:hypothetical protein
MGKPISAILTEGVKTDRTRNYVPLIGVEYVHFRTFQFIFDASGGGG